MGVNGYGAALNDLGRGDDREVGRWMNNRAENSHLPFRRRERAMLRFRRMRSLQMFASVHASVSNHFDHQRALSPRQSYKAARAAALSEWRTLFAASGRIGWGKLRQVRIRLTAPILPFQRKDRTIKPWDQTVAQARGNPVKLSG